MNAFGTKLGTVGIALVSIGTITVASTIQDLAGPIPAIQLTAESPPVMLRISPTVVLTSPSGAPAPSIGVTAAQSTVQQVSVVESLLRLDLGRFIIPPSATQPVPPPPAIQAPTPSPSAIEFEDAIINTYYTVEPWVRWGFELATYAVGWVPWVGWLAPQIMIFYNFGERIVESLVVNSANWLGGSLSFVEALGNVATDSWNAVVQLGIDQWNFWLPSLPPLPPLPLVAQETPPEQVDPVDTLAAADEQRTSPAVTLDAERKLPADPGFVAPERSQEFSDPELVTPENVEAQENLDLQPTVAPEAAVANVEEPDVVEVQADSPPKDAATAPTGESVGTPLDNTASPGTAPATPMKKKPFGKKSRPTTVASTPSTQRSEESAEASHSETTKANVGRPTRPKVRTNDTKKHRATTSPSNETASAPDAA